MRSKRSIPFLLMAAVLAGCSQGPVPVEPRVPSPATKAAAIDPAGLEALLDPVLAEGMAKEHIPGAVVVVVQHGRVVFQKGYARFSRPPP